MSPHVLDLAGGSQNSDEYTDFVHYRVEECIQGYKSKEETVKLIFDTFGIPHRFTRLIWHLLEKANPDFFSQFKTHCEKNRNAPSEEVTAPAQTTLSNAETETSSKPDEDLPEASTSFKEPDNKPRARRSKAGKAKELQQRPISPIRCLTETGSNDASSQVSQESATTNAGGAQIPVGKNSSKVRPSKARKKAKQKKQQLHASQQQQQAPCPHLTETAPNVESAEVLSQESTPTADAEIILKQISTSLRLLESIIEQVHKLLSNVLGPPRSTAKVLKKQRSWKQVRGGYEQAEMLQDLNQQLEQEMQSLDIPGNQASEEDTQRLDSHISIVSL